MLTAIGRDTPRLIFAEQLRRRLPSWLFLVIDIGEFLPGAVRHELTAAVVLLAFSGRGLTRHSSEDLTSLFELRFIDLTATIIIKVTCPYRKLNPDVLVMQSAENWHRHYTAD